MQLNHVQRQTKRTRSVRVGRGGKRGTTSGRGTKGQKARAGHRMRPEVRDTIKKLPKLRGHGKNRSRTINPTKIRPMPVNLARLDKAFADGDKVTPSTLSRVGLIRGRGHMTVKILGTGSLNKKLSVTGCMVSASARKGIEDAGGTVVA